MMQNGTIVGVHDQRFSAETGNNKGLHWGSVATQKKAANVNHTAKCEGPFPPTGRRNRWGGRFVLCSKTTLELNILDAYHSCSLLLFSL